MAQTIITAGDASVGLVQTAGNDGTLVVQAGAAGSKVSAISFAADGTATFLKVPLITALQSMVRLNTANGYGSTNVGIRRFTNTVTNQGADITYADSATLGATFTINTNGVYAISYTDQFTTAGNLGISLNSTQLSTSILLITAADRLGASDTPTGNANNTFATSVYLASGSVIRAHTNGVATGTTPSNVQFTITRVE